MTALYTPEPSGRFHSRRPRKDVAQEPRELRPSLLRAKQAIGEVEAELDAEGIPHCRVESPERGTCHVYSGDALIAWTFAVTDEPAALSIETLTADFRERLRAVTAELDAEMAE